MSLHFTEPVTEEEKNLIDVEDSQIYFYEEEKGKYICVYYRGYGYLIWPYFLLKIFNKEKFEEYDSYMNEIDTPNSDEDNLEEEKIDKPITLELNRKIVAVLDWVTDRLYQYIKPDGTMNLTEEEAKFFQENCSSLITYMRTRNAKGELVLDLTLVWSTLRSVSFFLDYAYQVKKEVIPDSD